MPQPRPKPFELDSTDGPDREYLELPSQPRHKSLARRLADWRQERMARQALRIAGEPNLVLDLPCGSGRFWPTLARHPNRLVLAADEPAPPLARPHASRRVEIAERICALHS